MLTPDIIQEALTQNPSTASLEEPLNDQDSPLNQPVVEKEEQADTENISSPSEDISNEFHIADEDLDAPEQVIDEKSRENEPAASMELPPEQAGQAADALLGVTDNVLEIGGGYFVRIKKHKLFYEFEEVIEVIDNQNEKNIQRIKLQAEDKILLRPLLAAVIQKRAQYLSPEQQLLGAVLSILFKKVQVVAQIRMENEVLIERILHIIKQETETSPKGTSDKTEASDISESVIDFTDVN